MVDDRRSKRLSFLVGGIVGLLISQLQERRSRRAFIDVVERGDFDAAETALRWNFFGHLPQWFRRPPPFEGEDEES